MMLDVDKKREKLGVGGGDFLKGCKLAPRGAVNKLRLTARGTFAFLIQAAVRQW